MKKIKQQEIQAIMEVLRKYNVGVNEFVAIQTMFEKLPEIKEEVGSGEQTEK